MSRRIASNATWPPLSAMAHDIHAIAINTSNEAPGTSQMMALWPQASGYPVKPKWQGIFSGNSE